MSCSGIISLKSSSIDGNTYGSPSAAGTTYASRSAIDACRASPAGAARSRSNSHVICRIHSIDKDRSYGIKTNGSSGIDRTDSSSVSASAANSVFATSGSTRAAGRSCAAGSATCPNDSNRTACRARV